jgi:hypothetical protein
MFNNNHLDSRAGMLFAMYCIQERMVFFLRDSFFTKKETGKGASRRLFPMTTRTLVFDFVMQKKELFSGSSFF